jgi:3'(2'), 5'-bisphosphate nucleotidase
MNKLLNLAIRATLEAGGEILKIYNSDDLGVELKADESPLTKADIASNNLITRYLQTTKIPILSEEGKSIPFNERKHFSQLWIVDPIDGTKEFIKRNGEFTVNIALIEKGITKLGVIYVPVLQELYFADEVNGSFKASNIDPEATFELIKSNALSLPILQKNNKYTVVASRSHLSQETIDFIDQLEKTHGELNIISKGSSLKLCLVAEGTANCYPRFAPTMEWDIAAGHAICKFTGVEVIDLSTNSEMLYNREELRNNWFLARRN